MITTPQMQRLRAELGEKFPLAQRKALSLLASTASFSVKSAPSTSTPFIHRLISGKLIEITPSTATSPTTAVLHQILQSNITGYTALIDSNDSFEPAAVQPQTLEKLLWLRCQSLQQALQSADLLLRDGNLSTVLLDLRLQPLLSLKKLPNSTWHRLRLLSAHHGLALAIFTPAPVVPCRAERWTIELPKAA